VLLVKEGMQKVNIKVSKKQIEALAIAECMTNNSKEKCFIYAIDDKVVWK
jgi:hypothetical protein